PCVRHVLERQDRPPRQRRPPMKQRMITLALLTTTLGTVGCGVNEDLDNATVRDRDAEKQKLAATQTALDAEKAQRKKEIDARDARILVLSNKLTSLGQDVSRLETERGGLSGELVEAQKRME